MISLFRLDPSLTFYIPLDFYLLLVLISFLYGSLFLWFQLYSAPWLPSKLPFKLSMLTFSFSYCPVFFLLFFFPNPFMNLFLLFGNENFLGQQTFKQLHSFISHIYWELTMCKTLWENTKMFYMPSLPSLTANAHTVPVMY